MSIKPISIIEKPVKPSKLAAGLKRVLDGNGINTTHLKTAIAERDEGEFTRALGRILYDPKLPASQATLIHERSPKNDQGALTVDPHLWDALSKRFPLDSNRSDMEALSKV